MGPMFFQRNRIDKAFTGVVLTVVDAVATDTGQDSVDSLRDRSNNAGWGTTDSTDAAGTQIEIDLNEGLEITDILMVEHNFASYKWEQWNGSTWVDLEVDVDVSGNSETTTWHDVGPHTATKYRLTINGCMVVDDDKRMLQLYLVKKIGAFHRVPFITPRLSKNRKRVKLISQKEVVYLNVGSFSCSMKMDHVVDKKDLELQEELFDIFDGFHVWICRRSDAEIY